MWTTPSACCEPGCFQPAIRGSRYCTAHQAGNATKSYDRDRNANDPIRKLYTRARWLRLSAFLRRKNPTCQRIKRCFQCMKPSEVVHHLISPYDRLDLFHVPTNLVCLCADCHPGGTAGTPDWNPGVDFVPTEYEIMLANQA